MAAPTASFLQDTQKLVQVYNKYPRFRNVFLALLNSNRPILYRGRPLKSYVFLINSLSPNLSGIYKRSYKNITGSFGKDNDFFIRYYRSPNEFNKLDDQIKKGGYLGHLSEPDRINLERIESIKNRKTKTEQYERWAPPQISSPQISSPTKDATSFLKIQSRRLLTNVVNSERISNTVGAVGNTLLGTAGKIAGGGLNVGGAASQLALLTPYGRAIAVASKLKYIIIGIVVLLLIAFLPGGQDLFTTTPLLYDFLDQTPSSKTPPSSPTGTGQEIAQCKFYRAGDGINSEKIYKSPLLLSYFNEASGLSGIPAVLLAAFVRVESPSTLDKIDPDLNNSCPESETGALGIMQIQPAGTTGHDSEAVNNGAKYIGKTVDTLTKEDYCDARKNILIGTGFIIHKMGYLGYKFNEKWNPEWTSNKAALGALAESYYGCPNYGGANPLKCEGPYLYGDDLWTSIQSCKITTPAPQPVALPEGDLKIAIKQQFGIDFQGKNFKENHLRWAWEILSLTKQKTAKFFELLGPNVIASTHSAVSERTGRTIFFSTLPNGFLTSGTEQQFKVLLIHELAHIIRGDPGSSQAENYDKLMLDAIDVDNNSYLTKYSDKTCFGGSQVDEDFSETVTYFINSGVPEQDLGCGIRSSSNPIYEGSYPGHAEFVRKLFTK